MKKNNSPAEVAAQKSLDGLYLCIDERKSFILEAGAGAGKTYSLNKVLSYALEKKGKNFLRKSQKIACITYTNIAADNFSTTQKNHPALFSGTIHSFCWNAISKFQHELRRIAQDNNKLTSLLEEEQSLGDFAIVYDFGFRKIEEDEIKIHHDDVITFFVSLLDNPKFVNYLSNIFPIILIDEYQDTNETLVLSILEHIVRKEVDILIGFFGDEWQKIYGDGCGEIKDSTLKVITKKSNFRSEKNIINALNRIRPELEQEVVDPHSNGSIRVYTSNETGSGWLTRNHWQDSLPEDQAKEKFETVKRILIDEEQWSFNSDNTKTLMLTHRNIATEQGYPDIVSLFRYNDSFIKKQDKHIEYFVDILEPIRELFEQQKYGEMFVVLGRKFPHIATIHDKKKWYDSMQKLFEICDTGTVDEVINFLRENDKPRISSKVLQREINLEKALEKEQELSNSQEELIQLKCVPYLQVRELARFITGYTPFSTQHGVKGDEFSNVLAIFGRGWNMYDWNKFLELSHPVSGDISGNEDFYVRNRNLFYVACSRPIKNLTLLFTQRLSRTAIETLEHWFGTDKITHL